MHGTSYKLALAGDKFVFLINSTLKTKHSKLPDEGMACVGFLLLRRSEGQIHASKIHILSCTTWTRRKGKFAF